MFCEKEISVRKQATEMAIKWRLKLENEAVIEQSNCKLQCKHLVWILIQHDSRERTYNAMLKSFKENHYYQLSC